MVLAPLPPLTDALAFQGGVSHRAEDPGLLLQLARQMVPMQSLRPLAGAHSVAFRAVSLELLDLQLLACAHEPLEAGTAQHDRALVVLPYAGGGEWVQRGHRFTLQGEPELLFLTGEPYSVSTGTLNTVYLTIDPARLERTALALRPPQLPPRQVRQRLRQPQLLRGHNPLELGLLLQLRRSIALLDLPQLSGSPLLSQLGIDELLYRQLAQLLCLPATAAPARLPGSPPPNPAAALREHILDDLCTWIDANLHLPIRLADLQARSTYSPRLLQLAFQQRCGCSPIQWVRRRRLAQALQLLEQPQPATSVQAVARACGYSSRAAFSRDFHQAFSRRASDVLRQARFGAQPEGQA